MNAKVRLIPLMFAVALSLTGCGGSSGSTTAGLTAPTGLAATSVSSSEIDLRWDPVQGAASYTVYRSSDANPTATSVATVTDTTYRDSGLFAGTAFNYRVATTTLSAPVSTTTAAFVANDVRVGDPAVSYGNVEFTADNKYMVWFEQSTDGSGLGTVWHCTVDPDTGALNPPDGKGYMAFQSTAWGRANPGVDSQGMFYVGMDRSGNLIMVRPTGPTTGTQTILSTPPSLYRRAIYPTDLPGGDAYVFWILNSDKPGSGYNLASSNGGSYTPVNNSFTLQYISLADPANIRNVETQGSPTSVTGTSGIYAPMDFGFARWFQGKAALSYGALDSNGYVQVKECDVDKGCDADSTDNPPYFITNDNHSKVDPWTMVFGSSDLILPGLDATSTSGVYSRASGGTTMQLAETITPPASELANPALAQSNQSIVFDGLLYTAYQVDDQGGSFYGTITNTGEIWLSTVLQSPPTETQWLISAPTLVDPGVASLAKSEPEPLEGNGKVWVFYSAVPAGSNFATATWQLLRATTPIGKR